MIYKDPFRKLTDEERARYLFSFCENCPLYDECELINGYIVKQVEKNKVVPPAVTIAWLSHKANGRSTAIVKEDNNLIEQNRSPVNLPFHIREVWENGVCPMRRFIRIECGNQWVVDGIGDDFKVDVKYDYKTERYEVDKSSYKRNYQTNRWEPRQPVFILAPTGGGKNTLAEGKLPEYIRELNHLNKTDYRVLIFSNRRALTEQARNRLEKGITEDDDIYYNYKEYVDVMPYHSLLNKAEYLKRFQQGKSKYLFVICDEVHYFVSDAAFNPDTEKILEAIVDIFQDAIRVYMTATPYECLKHIWKKESQRDKYIPGVIYHFKRDYRYLNTKYFSDEDTELKDIILDSVINNNEKWLIFIDNKKQGANFKRLLEDNDGVPTALKGKVMAVDADSKYKDKQYQEMIVTENFGKGINVVIGTSVIDNGINFRNIQNVVITDTDRIKCLQMVGRARVDKDPVTKAPLSKVTLYIKRHTANFISKRLKGISIQQDAYHDFDMAAEGRNFKWEFLDKYKDNEQDDWEKSKHLFGRYKDDPDKLYHNEIARLLANKQVLIYESILQEMEKSDKGKKVTGQKYLEFQLSWFGKKYSKKNDITLNGYKTDGQLGFEKWVQAKWLDKKILKETQKDFGKQFFANYNPIFGLCTKKQGFSSDDNRSETGPKTAGYSIKRIKEIFQIKNMPFEIIEDDGCCIILNT